MYDKDDRELVILPGQAILVDDGGTFTAAERLEVAEEMIRLWRHWASTPLDSPS